MVDTQLKPIRNLRSKSDVRSFSHIRSLDTSEFFPSCWIGMMDILLMQKQYEVLLEVFIKTIYFFNQSNSQDFETKHAKTIKRFSYFIEKQDHGRIKEMIFDDEVWFLLKDIEDWISYDENSFLAPLQPLLNFIRIGFIEKADGFDDVCWNADSDYLTLHLFQTNDQIFLLYPKDKLIVESFQNHEKDDQSPLLVNYDEPLSPQGEETQVSSFEDSFEENDEEWLETVNILNKHKDPLFTTDLKVSASPESSTLDLPIKEQASFKSCLLINKGNFFKSFMIQMIETLINFDLFHIALSLFSNTIYHFPQSQVLDFEKSFSNLIKSFNKVLNQSQKEDSLVLLKSDTMEKMMDQIESFAEHSRNSDVFLIRPYFPLFRCCSLTLIEKTAKEEFIWKSKKTIITVVLYESQGNIYLLVPHNAFHVKKLETKDEELRTESDAFVLKLNDEPSDILVIDQQDNDLVENDGFQSRIQTKRGNDSPRANDSPSKVISFSPMLEIEISSPSTPRNQEHLKLQNKISNNSQNLDGNPKSIISDISKNTCLKPPRPESTKYSTITSQKIEKIETKVEKPGFQIISTTEIIKTRVIHHSVCEYQESPPIPFKDLSKDIETKSIQSTTKSRKSQSYDLMNSAAARPVVNCGSFLCTSCSRELFRSSDFLIVSKNPETRSNPPKISFPAQCCFCSSSSSKKFRVLCASCFISSLILNSPTFCSSRAEAEWLNIHQEATGNDSTCEFCDFPTLNDFLVELCAKCKESACLTCIRRNEYLVSGNCSYCRAKRAASSSLVKLVIS